MSYLRASLPLIAALAFAASPLTTNGFRGFAPNQFPIPQIDPPVQPAGYAFAIWGAIYLWLIAGAAYGLIRRADDPDWQPMRPALTLSMMLGAGWIPVAQISPVWATAMIWAMLASAVWALRRAGQADHWWLRAPVALYAGWLTAASCVAVGLLLAGHGVMGAQAAALTALALALGVALGVQSLRPDAPTYAIAVIWALAGVVVANLAPLNGPVVGVCAVGMAVVLLRAVRARRPLAPARAT
ncbi:hypothetical protein EOM89_02210 [Candidatus Falkowbacteria bacterium]|nr:hypothetical protein [Candidatus Falkowbacteria bacterium]